MKKKIEILAPVGNFEMLTTAINAGANSVYLGIKGINMRAGGARNFTLTELNKVVKQAHKANVKVYLTLNTIIYENELKKVEKIIDKAKKIGVDAIIAWDLSVLKMCKEKKLEVHLSTQASVSNSTAINEYKKYRVKRVVLARECTIGEIKKLSKKTILDIEVFAHGAMCVSESGRCFMSEYQYGASANRGKCYQTCRRKYLIKDAETGDELEVDGKYVLSPKDLCTIPIIDKIIKSGATVLKIEGRARTPEYVDTVVRVYKEAIKLAQKNKLTLEKKKELVNKLRNVFNRDFSTGFFMNRPIKEFWNEYGGAQRYKKQFLGKVLNYYSKANVFYGKLNTGNIKIGDTLIIIGPTSGIIYQEVKSLRDSSDKEVKQIKKGESFTTPIKSKIRKNDDIYLRVENK